MSNIDSFISHIQAHAKSILNEISFTTKDIDKISKLCTQVVGDTLTSQEKGVLLERMILEIFIKHKLFDIKSNIRTSTNEIDLLLAPSHIGSAILSTLYNSFFTDNIILECKNYKDNIGVTYIGKLGNLVSVSNSKIGIMITRKGITGVNNWNDGKGLIRKISLKHDVQILDFKLDDFLEIKGITIFELLQNKLDALLTDTNIEHWTKHDLESQYQGILENA